MKPIKFDNGTPLQLNRALVKFGRAEEAREIQGELCAMLELIKGSLYEIWMAEETSDGGGEGVKYGPEATTADIVENRESDKKYRPPYHLLGERLHFNLHVCSKFEHWLDSTPISEPHLRRPPAACFDGNWKLEILS